MAVRVILNVHRKSAVTPVSRALQLYRLIDSDGKVDPERE